MWDIDAETKALALSPARHIWVKAIFGAKSGNTWTNDRTYCETDKVVSAAVDIGAKSGGIQVGNAFCGKLTLRLLDGAEIHQTDRIIMRVGFYKSDGTKSETISLGWYYIDAIKKSGGVYTIIAYDKMLRAQKSYNSKLTYPAKMSDVLGEICDSLGVNLASDFAIPYDGTISEKPIKGKDSDGNEVYYTRREMLSYLASAMGGNFFFNVGGHLQLTRFAAVDDLFSAANSIEAEISADSYSVKGIVWTLGGVTYSRNDEDTDGIMEFENPLTFYPKEPVQHAIEERVTGLNYHEATIRRQGCGWFELGDIVTAYRADGTSAPVLVTGLSYSIADGGFTEKIYSSARSSSQDNYTTGDITGQSVPQSVGGTVQNPSGTGSTLTEYKYLTDSSVKINGTTYTVEKDAETGLISKISDSAGNEFEPEISAGITDVAAHNAVFWAVAMCRGLGQKIYGNTNIFDLENASAGLWKNTGDGYDIILSEGSTISSDGVHMGSSIHLPISDTLSDYTMFVVAKMRSDFTSSEWTSVIANYGTPPQFNICSRNLRWSIGTGTYDGRYFGDYTCKTMTVLAAVKSKQNGKFFVNTALKNSMSVYVTPIGAVCNYWDINGDVFIFKHISIIPGAMSDDEIVAEVQRLSTKYNVGGNT